MLTRSTFRLFSSRSKWFGQDSLPRSTFRLFSSRSKWFGQDSLPYLNNVEYLDTLERYVSKRPGNSVLTVWGAKSVAKSRGLQIKIEVHFCGHKFVLCVMLLLVQTWRREGASVIDVNLKGTTLTLSDFATRLATAIDVGLKVC